MPFASCSVGSYIFLLPGVWSPEMTLTRNVNGEDVELTPRGSEWEAQQALDVAAAQRSRPNRQREKLVRSTSA